MKVYVTGKETAARTFREAIALQVELDRSTGRKWCVSDGPRNWKTGKPLCFIVKLSES